MDDPGGDIRDLLVFGGSVGSASCALAPVTGLKVLVPLFPARREYVGHLDLRGNLVLHVAYPQQWALGFALPKENLPLMRGDSRPAEH